MKRSAGLTLVETLIVITIIIVVVSIALPVIGKVRKSARITQSVSQMRQIYVAIEIYRSDYDGNEGSYTYKNLALPYHDYVLETKLGLSESVWQSPCGSDKTVFDTGPGGMLGWITYGPGTYDDRYVYPGSKSNPEYHTYLADYRQNAVLLLDYYCNEPGTNLQNPVTRKRALAILLSGKVVNTWRTGDAFYLQFYSDPPDQ